MIVRPLVVVSDVHLGHRACAEVAADLARLVTAHPGYELVLDGDTFNLSCDPPAADPGTSAAAMLQAHPVLLDALGRHLSQGGTLTLLAGNHDLDVQQPRTAAALSALLGAGATALQVHPWFVRRGDVHIEHGHLYDPDNAPAHPLSAPTFQSEPLGVALSRRFLGPYNAYALGERYDATAADNARLLLKVFGRRAPFAMLHYAALLVRINVETIRARRLDRERRAGDAALPAFATLADLPEPVLRAMLAAAPPPTHASAARTFARFDFDGTVAALAIPAGAATAVAAPLTGAAVAASGAAYLLLTRPRRRTRASNHMPEYLRTGAATVRQLTGARLVIFGHSHREETSEGYMNLGAFGDPPRPARTYIHIDGHGDVERRALRGPEV